mmetsp:Transcript_74092/g.192932  ORF Transcript_74092/g.192932 Transcript_74092/m.192932 type:complete len:229 (-) Transcript_74092:1459-2145(-)
MDRCETKGRDPGFKRTNDRQWSRGALSHASLLQPRGRSRLSIRTPPPQLERSPQSPDANGHAREQHSCEANGRPVGEAPRREEGELELSPQHQLPCRLRRLQRSRGQPVRVVWAPLAPTCRSGGRTRAPLLQLLPSPPPPELARGEAGLESPRREVLGQSIDRPFTERPRVCGDQKTLQRVKKVDVVETPPDGGPLRGAQQPPLHTLRGAKWILILLGGRGSPRRGAR